MKDCGGGWFGDVARGAADRRTSERNPAGPSIIQTRIGSTKKGMPCLKNSRCIKKTV
jgi:hypothetical protein